MLLQGTRLFDSSGQAILADHAELDGGIPNRPALPHGQLRYEPEIAPFRGARLSWVPL